MQSNLARFVEPARAYPQLWRLGLGVVVIVLIALAGVMGLAALVGLSGVDLDAQTFTFVALASFGPMALGAWLAARIHWRGLDSLLGGWRATVRDFGRAAVVLVPIFVLFLGVGFVVYGAVPNLSFGEWLVFLPLLLPLLFIQISAEELVFRGYLMQQLAARFSAPLVWIGLPAIGFGLLHYDAQAGVLAWGLVAVTLVFALIASDLTRRTGNLGAALALHFVNNFSALAVLGIDDNLSGLALYRTPFDLSDAGPLFQALLLDLVALLIVWRLLRRWFA